jgi:anti-sigma factor RsiW
MRMLRRRNELACRQVVELVTDYLEGTLPRAQRRRLEAHLAGCPHCSEYLEQMRATIRLTGRIASSDVTAEMEDDLGAIYRSWRAEETDETDRRGE